MQAVVGSREFREEIVGKTISGVIARPGREGQPPVVLMLRFEDGSVVEFISPRSDRLLRRSLGPAGHPWTAEKCPAEPGPQLTLDGLLSVPETAEAEVRDGLAWC